MDNFENRRWYKNYCNCWTLACMIVAIFSFSVGIKQYFETLTYIPTYCLVKNSSLQNCGTQHQRYKSSVQQCFRGMWLVDYIDYGKWEQTTIIDSNFWVDRNHIRHQHHGLTIYEVDRIYGCYHSIYLSTVQWRKPSSSTFILLMLCGTLSTSFFIWTLTTHCRNKHRSNNTYHNIILPNTLPRSAASTTRGMRMDNIPSTMRLPQTRTAALRQEFVLGIPPPLYAPSIHLTEQEAIPSTPPPPYTPSIIPMQQQEENIPSSPPPAYSLSST